MFSTTDEQIPDLFNAAQGRLQRTREIRDSKIGKIVSFSAVAQDEAAAEAIDREMQGKGHVKEK